MIKIQEIRLPEYQNPLFIPSLYKDHLIFPHNEATVHWAKNNVEKIYKKVISRNNAFFKLKVITFDVGNFTSEYIYIPHITRLFNSVDINIKCIPSPKYFHIRSAPVVQDFNTWLGGL